MKTIFLNVSDQVNLNVQLARLTITIYAFYCHTNRMLLNPVEACAG